MRIPRILFLFLEFTLCNTLPDQSVTVTGTTIPPSYYRREGISSTGEQTYFHAFKILSKVFLRKICIILLIIYSILNEYCMEQGTILVIYLSYLLNTSDFIFQIAF